jgi:hypothetical protein
VSKRANLSKSKFFGIMACPKTGITEFRRPFDQGSQTRCHLRLSPLIIDEWRKQMSVHPLRGNVYINQEPPSGGTPPRALEGGIDVVLLVAVTQQQPDPRADDLVIMSRRVEVIE